MFGEVVDVWSVIPSRDYVLNGDVPKVELLGLVLDGEP